MNKIIILLLTLSAFLCSCKKNEADKPNPSIDFTFSGNTGTAPASVAFTATLQNASTVSWEFGDGQTGTGTSVTHIYSTLGLFEVTAKTTSEDGVSASQIKYVNVSPYSRINITQVFISVPTSKPVGGTWDTNPGATNPDLYCKIFNSSGSQITSQNTYANNVFSTTYVISPIAQITDFNGKFTVKVFDYDLGATQDETIATFEVRPGDSFSPTLPFPNIISKSSGGTQIKIYTSWN